jgi:hypothetical protein
LHGLGQTGHKWSLKLEKIQSPHVKYICPTASLKVLLKGSHLSAWIVPEFMPSGAADLNNYVISESSIKEAIKTVHGIVEEEISQGIDSQRIILGTI